MTEVVQLLSSLRFLIALCPLPQMVSHAAIREDQARRSCKTCISKIKLAFGYDKIRFVDGFRVKKAVCDAALPTSKDVSESHLEVAGRKVVQRELTFAIP